MAVERNDDDPLKAALPTAFSQPISLPSSPVEATSSATAPPQIAAPTSNELPSLSASGDDGSWREEHDSRVSEWRARSAISRKKAEETRERYAAIRAQEEAEAAASAGSGRQPLPPQRGFGPPGSEQVGVADNRDVVAGEPQGHHQSAAASISSPPVSISHPSDMEHERWEDVPSVVSSFPSLPSHESPPSQPQTSSKDAEKADEKAPETAHPSAAEIARPQPPAVTPLVLDTTLPVKTRAFALLSSVAINMFLPFVNGVMLGFGELFARNVLAPWIGWQSILKPNGIRTLQPKAPAPMSPGEIRREELRKRQLDL